MGKRFLHRRQVIENIGVVELHIVYDANFRKVVDELTSLIKKSRVIFIPLKNDPLAIGKPGTTGKITRKTSDEKRWIPPGKIQYPGNQGGGRRLAMRTRHTNGAKTAYENFSQQFWQ